MILNELHRLGTDSAQLLVGFPLGLAALTVSVVGLAVGTSLAVVGIGIPILVATLYAARGFATVERRRISAVLGRAFTDPPYRRPQADAGAARRLLVGLTDPQSWRDVVYSVLRAVPATAGFAIMVTWWLGALAGLTAPLWHRWLPGGAYTIGSLLVDGGGSAQVAVDVAVGVVFLVTLVPVVRGLAVLDASVASMLTRADEPHAS
jgi:hypothetical protein